MDEKKRKQGKASREKGARFERELSKLFNEHGFNTHRGYVQFKQSDVIGLDGIHIEAKAVEIINLVIKEGLGSGKGPAGVAAAALYVASLLLGERKTQSEIANVAGVTEVTIRNRYKELSEKVDVII